MANKRMFTMKIVDSDAFLDMPLSTQCLYFHLNMRADDDGFIGNPNKVMRMIGASQDDLKLLIAKRFVLSFEDGVIVIKHWRMHNTLSQNRYQETQYLDEKSELLLKENGSYSFNDGKPIDDSKMIESSKRQVRRAIDVQKTSADIDKDIDLDKGKDIGTDKISLKKTKAKESTVNDYDFSFDAEKAWNDTFAIYPKTKASAVAKQAWMNKLLEVIPQNQKDMAIIIYKAVKMYVADYDERNPEDVKNHQYIPKFDKWLTEDCDYWISQVEKGERE